jgi:hypothetical protein
VLANSNYAASLLPSPSLLASAAASNNVSLSGGGDARALPGGARSPLAWPSITLAGTAMFPRGGVLHRRPPRPPLLLLAGAGNDDGPVRPPVVVVVVARRRWPCPPPWWQAALLLLRPRRGWPAAVVPCRRVRSIEKDCPRFHLQGSVLGLALGLLLAGKSRVLAEPNQLLLAPAYLVEQSSSFLGGTSSCIDLEAPAEVGTKMGIMVGFRWCVVWWYVLCVVVFLVVSGREY